MATTIYSFHRVEDHAILATAEPANLQDVAARIAKSIANYPAATTRHGHARRVYIHNGLGIVGAGLCRDGIWHDILRDDYHQFDDKARDKRAADGLANDPKTGTEKGA